jgi:hypothetical protein
LRSEIGILARYRSAKFLTVAAKNSRSREYHPLLREDCPPAGLAALDFDRLRSFGDRMRGGGLVA